MTLPPLLRVACSAVLTLLLAVPAFAEGSLQSEPAGRDAPDRTVDVRHLTLHLEVDMDAGRVAGRAELQVAPLRPGITEVVLHQVGLDIQGVQVDGADAPFRTGPTTLTIQVPERATGAAYLLTIRYAATPSLGLHFRRPGPDSPDTYAEVWSQGEDVDNRHWMPIWDFPNDRFTYEGNFTLPERFTALSNGILESKAPTGDGRTTWRFALRDQDLVAYLVMFAAAEYQYFEDAWRGRPVGYYLPPDATEAAGRLLLGKTPAMLEWMSTLLGVEYPYPLYDQVLVQRFIYTGMENTTATVLDRRLLLPPAPHRPSRHTESIIAHELAHQWFGDLLTCRTWAHMWLNEGLTSWLTSEWLRKEYGEDEWADAFMKRMAGIAKADDAAPLPMVGTFYNRVGERNSAHVYSKGATVTHMLRVLLGDDAFFRGMTGYLTEHQHGTVETEDLRRAMEEASGLHLRWFFDQWVYLAGHPKLKVGHAIRDGRVRVSLKQTQKREGNVPLFDLPLDLEIGTTGGVRVERVVLRGADEAVSFDLGGESLLYVGVDPFAGVLMDLDQTQTAAEWTAQLQSPHAFTRRRAVDGLQGLKATIPDATRAAVEALARTSGSPTARRMAVRILGEWRDPASRAVVVDVLTGEPKDGPESALRTEAVEALAKGEATPDVIEALADTLKRDGDHWTRSKAISALAALEERRVRPRALAALRTETDGHFLAFRAAQALGRWGEAADIGALESRFRPNAAGTRLRHASLRAAAAIAGREPVGADRDRARAPVREAAEAWLHSLHLRDRQVALGVLSQVGDAGSIDAVQALLRRDDAPSIQRRGPGTIEKIRTRTEVDADETSGELKAKLKTLEEQLQAMDEELKALQERR